MEVAHLRPKWNNNFTNSFLRFSGNPRYYVYGEPCMETSLANILNFKWMILGERHLSKFYVSTSAWFLNFSHCSVWRIKRKRNNKSLYSVLAKYDRSFKTLGWFKSFILLAIPSVDCQSSENVVKMLWTIILSL